MSVSLKGPARLTQLVPTLVCFSLFGFSFLAGSGSAATRRPITETDLFRFVWVADPQISPDGRRVAFVRVTVNAKKDGYDTALWVAATDGAEPPRPFTSGLADSSPRWSPDGKRLAFVRAPAKGDGKKED